VLLDCFEYFGDRDLLLKSVIFPIFQILFQIDDFEKNAIVLGFELEFEELDPRRVAPLNERDYAARYLVEETLIRALHPGVFFGLSRRNYNMRVKALSLSHLL